MKLFALFAGQNYYPAGGFDDLITTGADAEALADYAYRAKAGILKNAYDWWHVADMTSEPPEMVYSSFDYTPPEGPTDEG